MTSAPELAEKTALTHELERVRDENAALRRELSTATHESEENTRFRELAEAMPQLVWTCTADGACDYLGPQWEEYTGAPASEQLGSAWLEKLHPDDRERVNREWTLAASVRRHFDVDFRIRRRDGVYRWFKTRAVPVLAPDGAVTRWLGTNTDIEDLRCAELEVLRLKEGLERQVDRGHAEIALISERLLLAAKAAGLGIWDWNVTDNQLVWNEQMYDIYEIPELTFQGAYEAWTGALHPEDKERAETELAKALAGRSEFNTSFRIVTPSGETRHIRATAKVYRNQAGEPVRMLGLNWDVTSEVDAQKEAREAEQRLTLALESTGDGVWDWDVVSDRVFLSRRSNELRGYQGESIATLSESKAQIHPDDLALVEAATQAHLLNQTPVLDCEYRVKHRDGGWVWILARGRATARDASGRPARMVGTHKDMTERRRAQEALKSSEGLLRQFITYAPAAIAMLDRDLRYIQASRRWILEYKLGDQDIIGRRHYDIFPDIPQRWKDVHQRVLAGAVEYAEDDPFERADGSIEWLNWEARPWRESNGQIGGIIFFTQVVTERRLMALKLEEQNRRLIQSNAELEQFAYVASHDLQEPLRAVAGCTQVLALRYQDRLGPDADQLISHIVDGATRMKALVEDLLRLSRVNTQHELSEVDVNQVVEEATRNLSAVIQSANASVEVPRLPVVRADHTQLLQLFQNLIGNAIKYRRAEPPRVRVKVERKGTFYEFSIADNGIGIEAQYFERIFGIFQRLHTRAEYSGTGIGLAICRKIVERHGGRIWLESKLGEGTTFHFTLPA